MTDNSGFQLACSGAEAYERYMVPIHCLARAEDLLVRAGLQLGQQVLDVGCGTGVVSRLAAPRVGARGHVTGVELNPEMLDVARRAAAFIDRLEFEEGNASSLSSKNDTFDVVVSQHALMFIPDRSAAVTEMRRVVKPGGRLALSVFRGLEHNPHFAVLVDGLARHGGREAADFIGSAFVVETVLQMRELFESAGWREVEVQVRAGTARYPSVEHAVRYETLNIPDPRVLEDALQRALVEELEAFGKDFVDDQGVVFPTSDYVVVARKPRDG